MREYEYPCLHVQRWFLLVTGQLLLRQASYPHCMKARLKVAFVTVALVSVVAGFFLYDRFLLSPGTGSTSPGGGSTSSSSCSDPASISTHVYHPYRLQIVKPCITASGTVDRVIHEADGDVHDRTNLVQDYRKLTITPNDQYQYGDLVVEIICVTPPSQTDAIPACQNYSNQITVPS